MYVAEGMNTLPRKTDHKKITRWKQMKRFVVFNALWGDENVLWFYDFKLLKNWAFHISDEICEWQTRKPNEVMQ